MGNICISIDDDEEEDIEEDIEDEYYQEDNYKNLQIKYNILVTKYNNLLDDYTYKCYKNRQIINDYFILFENYKKNVENYVDSSDYVIIK
jgi:hypothetical protein